MFLSLSLSLLPTPSSLHSTLKILCSVVLLFSNGGSLRLKMITLKSPHGTLKGGPEEVTIQLDEKSSISLLE